MEGDDLAHKVWGLINGPDGSHLKPPFNHYGDVDSPAVPSPPCPRDCVIEYLNPPAVPKAHIVMHTAFDDTTLACPPTTEFPTDWTSAESRIDLGNLSLYTARYGGQDRTGESRASSQIRHPATHRLSSTAPAFVPANCTPYDSRNALPQRDVDIRREELPTIRRHLNPVTPKIDGDLLTTSSTKAIHSTSNYDPQIYSPHSDMDGPWNELAIQPELFSAQHRLLAETIYPTKRFYSPACTIDTSCTTVLPSVALGSSYLSPSNEAHNPALGLLQANKPPTSFLVRRQDLSHQQPRSIPLTRLIQRRLSSVAEEDTTDSRFRLVSTTVANANSPCSIIPPLSSNTTRMKSCLEGTDKTARVKLPHRIPVPNDLNFT